MALVPGGSVSEKSLELNVTAEIIEAVKARLGQALAVGYTTKQEVRNGLDVSINGSGRVIIALQFKAPIRSTTLNGTQVYTYQIATPPRRCYNP